MTRARVSRQMEGVEKNSADFVHTVQALLDS
jgi:hypothetical protein